MIKSLEAYVSKKGVDADIDIILNNVNDEYHANLLSVDTTGVVLAFTNDDEKVHFYPWASIRRISIAEQKLLDDHVKFTPRDTASE